MYEAFFDAIIATVAIGVPTWYAVSSWRQKMKKGSGPGLIGPIALVIWGIVVYGSFIETRMLVVREYAVDLAPPGAETRTIRAAVISDLHLGTYRHAEWVAKVVKRINAEKPDVVLLAGDLASNLSGTKEFGPLKELHAPLGAYAALGNWDYRAGAVDVRRAVESTGVEMLINESIPLDSSGRQLRLAGLDDFQLGKPDWTAALAEAPSDATTIALVHNPDFVGGAEANGAALLIAGHTHAGQIRLPFLGPVPKLPTSLGQRYDKGVFPVGKTTLFITPGVGESGPRARLFDPPEISILRITY